MKILVWLVIILGVCTITLAVATIVLAVKYLALKNGENRSTITTTTPTPVTPTTTTRKTPTELTTPTQSVSLTTPEWTTAQWTTSNPSPAKEDSIVHDGTVTEITLDTIDAVVSEVAKVYTDKKLEVFVDSNDKGLEMLHRFAFATTYWLNPEQQDHLNLEININFGISDNDFDEFVDTVVSFIKKPNFLTIRTQSNKYIYRNSDRVGEEPEEQTGLTMNYDDVPQYIPNIPGHYNSSKWIVRIRSIAEPNNNEANEQQKKLVNLNDERCSLFRFWVDDNFSVTTVSKFLEKHNTGTVTTVTLTYDIKHGSQIFFNRLYVNLKNELSSDHIKNYWKLKVDFYSTLWSDDPIYNGNEKVPSIIFERATTE